METPTRHGGLEFESFIDGRDHEAGATDRAWPLCTQPGGYVTRAWTRTLRDLFEGLLSAVEGFQRVLRVYLLTQIVDFHTEA